MSNSIFTLLTNRTFTLPVIMSIKRCAFRKYGVNLDHHQSPDGSFFIGTTKAWNQDSITSVGSYCEGVADALEYNEADRQ